MSIVQEYLEYTQKWQKEYGQKTLVLMQVGSFFEAYSLRRADGSIYGCDSPYGSNIEEFASINDMIIANKSSFIDKKQVVMAGVGVAYIDKYLKRMQEHDYTVVLYKQDVNAKNTTRSLSEIISPGTFFSADSEELSNNVMCIWLHKSSANKYSGCQVTIGVANIDIFTGKTALFQFSADYNHNPSTYDELERYIAAYKPSECLLVANMPEKILNDIVGFIGLQESKIHKVDLTNTNTLNSNSNMLIFAQNAEKQIYQREILKRFYPHILEPEFFQASPTHFVATQAFCFLLDFVNQHSPNLVKKLAEPVFENYTDKLVLANHSLYQLNMIDDARHTGKLRSVSSLLNNCATTMGKRQFLYNLHNPITNKTTLKTSYDITEHLLYDKALMWQTLRSQLTGIKDIEKLKRKLVLQKVTPKDFALLAHDLHIISNINDQTLKDTKLTAYIQANNVIHNINEINIKDSCLSLLADLERVFDLEKCQTIGEITGDVEVFIQQGICPSIDKLVKESLDGREKLEAIRSYFSDVIKSVERTSKETQYIKIHETPKSDALLMGTSRRVEILKAFFKKQLGPASDSNTTVRMHYASNYSKKDESFVFDLAALDFQSVGSNKKDIIITSAQIRQITNDIQTSREKIVKELQWYFTGYVNEFAKFEPAINAIVQYTSTIDLLQCKCYIAHKYNYCKPSLVEKDQAFLTFTGIRHPLIEHLQTNELYVTNDLSLNNNKDASGSRDASGILLYGTNAVGKTSFIKSIGIALIMAQAGLYVPCQTFTYAPYNYVFTRILGNDNLFKGLSTFAVEMSELRTILKVADANSLVLGDELCSGTESDSALSIFTAGLEILHAKQCTFLFATHFHEINTYEEIKALNRLKMLHMAVNYDRERGVLVYDRKLREGPGESMYGLEVCKSLNLPDAFLQRAHDLRMKYNSKDKNILALGTSHFNTKKIVGLCELCEKEPASEVHHLQHQENASKVNAYIQSFHKNHVANLLNICDTCHKGIHKTGKQHKVKKTTKKYELSLVD
jgi:DNA mismatch repair protein MutS